MTRTSKETQDHANQEMCFNKCNTAHTQKQGQKSHD